jgi:hypothetical protein
MTLPGAMKVGCVIAVALAFNQRVCAQLEETAITTGPIVQTRPDDGSPIAATAGANIGFGLLRKLRSSISIVTGYDDNVNTSGEGGAGSGTGSLYTNGNASLSYSFGSPRTRVSLDGGGGISYYFDRPGDSDYDVNAYFALSLMHKFTKRLTLNLSALASYQSQPDFSTALGASQALGNFFRLTDTNSLSFLWGPRYSTITSYILGALTYESDIGSLQDRFEQTFGQQFRFLLFPSTTIDGEYRFGTIDYENAPLDSTTHFLLAGFDHRFTPHLNVSFRGGVEIRSSENNGSGLTPHFESTLDYAFGRRISVSWSNSYSIEESNIPGGSSGETFRTGVISQIKLTRRLSASLALNYILGGGDGSDSTIDIAPSVNLMIMRNLFANAGYHYTKVESGFLPYSRNNYFAGLNFSF